MKTESLCFPPFRIDFAEERVWRETTVVPLRPKSFAVLRHLVEHAEHLVTNDELLTAVWPGVVVSETMPRLCIREIRRALGDEATHPQFIETRPRRGYRFIAPLTTPPHSRPESRVQSLESGDPETTSHRIQTLDARRQTLDVPLVGRETELAQLHHWLDLARRGERQLVFVTGDPGVGKTTLVDAFLQGLASSVQRPASKQQTASSFPVLTLDPRHQTLDSRPWVARGQCLEQYGEGEAYLPMLEALGQLCRGPGGTQVVTVLQRYAPTWLVQMPSLVAETELEAVQRQVAGATRERMLREMADALEALTVEQSLVLVLEDLHVSDRSTVELIAYLAQRREPARLLVVGTYRPTEVVGHEHALKAVTQELRAHGQSEELRVERLSRSAVEEYLTKRLAAPTVPVELTDLLYQRTEGNPLFLVNVVDYCVRQHLLVQEDGQWQLKRDGEELEVPENVQQLIEKQVERLTDNEQRLLEVASVAGKEFTTAAVAAALQRDVDSIEDVCEELAQKSQFLQEEGMAEWPDGTLSGRYAFRHVLYQNVLYDRIAEARRVRLHRLLGNCQEHAYGPRAKEIAAELAMHFERSRDHQRAVYYLHKAGEKALRQSAHQEAIRHLTKGLELLRTLPATPERWQQELALQMALGVPLIATKSYGAPEVEKVYSRARELCQQLGETPTLFSVLRGLWVFYLVLGNLETSRELGEQLLRLAEHVKDTALLLEAHFAVGAASLWRGELAPARDHLELGTALYDSKLHASHAFLYGHDPGVNCLSSIARGLWALGYPDQALKSNHEAIALAQALSHPFSLASALNLAAMLSQLRQEPQATQEWAETVIALSLKQGFPLWAAFGTILRGWALAKQGNRAEGIAQIRQGLAAFRSTGTGLGWPYNLALLAEAHGGMGQAEDGLSAVAEALAEVDKTGERFCEAELYRLQGELILQKDRQQTKGHVRRPSRKTRTQHRAPHAKTVEREAEACFVKAIAIAQQQHAKSWELRATMSLARLWQQQGNQHEAHQVLSEVYSWFTEGFDTKNLREAKALLNQLSSSRD